MPNEELLQIGVDVGSTTVKAVVMDADGNVLWQDYHRHNAKQPELVREFMSRIESEFPQRKFNIFATGSGGRTIAPYLNAHYVQEVNAVTYAVEKLHPDTGAVIELGGQDAKVIIWKVDENGQKSTITFMNDKCAGGTGATIDKIFKKIGINVEDAQKISSKGLATHHVAAKCGVFAETDVVGLLKAGIDRNEIVLSLCTAIVKQNLEVLVRGNVLRDKVLLLGGPHAYLPVFSDIWREQIPQTWKIHNWTPQDLPLTELIQVPDDSQYFAAIGAVLFGNESEELFEATHNGQHIDSENHIYEGISKLDNYISKGRMKQLEAYGSALDGLVKSDVELEEFAKKYTIPHFEEPPLSQGDTLKGYIGIDGGSTSSKLVILNQDGVLFYKNYILSRGNPVEDVREMFIDINKWTKERGIELEILGTSVTGYASEILQQAFSLDVSVVETVAHMKSAVAYYGEVDVICDVGGQDIKVLFMKHGRVVDFKLNTQCSAGNGYFLQGMADAFGIPIEEYASHAFLARKAPAFNYGCAVFMEQDKVNFQQLGWSKEEIMAGLALVLPLNIWNYVVQETNIARLGKRFVLQGGTQKNLAAVKAQVDFIKNRIPDAEVHIHKYADIGGAIGAALEAIDSMDGAESSFVGVKKASDITFTSRNDESTRCNFCNNNCMRTFIDIKIPGKKDVRYISGYGCERGQTDNVSDMKANIKHKKEMQKQYPNLVAEAAKSVFKMFDYENIPESGYKPSKDFIKKYYTGKLKKTLRKGFKRSSKEAWDKRSQMIVGLPRLLNMYYYAPFFSTYLRTLGVGQIKWSDYTSSKLWNEGNKWGANDPCFPAKVAPAHIFNLFKKNDITHICFPRITHLESAVKNTTGENACVIQMGTPEVVQAVFTKDYDLFKSNNVEYWKPLVSLNRPVEATGLLMDYFKDILDITYDENAWAVYQGYKAQETYLESLRNKGRDIINWLVENDKIGILLIGHPYHHDPGLNHGIPESFQLHGFPVLCIESLPTTDDFLKPLFANDKSEYSNEFAMDITDVWQRNFNRNLNLKFWAAKVASRHPNIAVIDLSSFKCGFDAPSYSYIDNIMDASGTPHFLFHDIDQNKPGASFNIRIQTIEYFLKHEEVRLKANSKVGDFL